MIATDFKKIGPGNQKYGGEIENVPVHYENGEVGKNVCVGYHTCKITLPVMPLMVPVTLPIPVMSAARTGTVRPFILRFF
jgi:hypothetical protein